jgi:hypothetical protein
MKRLTRVAIVLTLVTSASAIKAADDPTGTWNWPLENLGWTFQVSAKLKLEGGKLTGTYTGRNMDSPIENGTFKDGNVSFTVTRDLGGTKFTMKYSGTLRGDTITGKIEGERDGQKTSADWNAKRQK